MTSRLQLETGPLAGLVLEAFGDERALPVLCLHGVAGDRRVLIGSCEPAFAGLPLRRLYVDLPGHGESQGLETDPSADGLVDALVSLVEEVAGQGPVALLGYAYGGYLALGAAARLPGLRGLALVCPTVEPDFGRRTVPPRRVAARDAELRFSDEDPREQAAFEEVAVLQTQLQLERFRALVHPGNIAAQREFVDAVRARYVLSRPWAAPLAGFDGPVIIAAGRDDHWVGWQDAARLVPLLPRAELAVLPDCGHLLPLEAPGRFVALLGEWGLRLLASVGAHPGAG
jgi:pimeloyl-ACP methyl ester carboxylesterase